MQQHIERPPGSAPLKWPEEGVARVPYEVYYDRELYRLEQERLFRGDIWNFLGLACEIPEVGDFRTTHVGDTPVVLVRNASGGFSAFENRCAHRGATLCYQPCGNRERFTCAYHNWTYDLEGNLKSVAFARGVRGQGGLSPDFDYAEHGLRKLRVDTLGGLVFGTYSEKAGSLESYLGPRMTAHAQRIFNRPIRVLGQYSQYMHNNWKLYMENVKDSYHASLLHTFFTTFRLNRLTLEGGLVMAQGGGHHISFSKMASEDHRKTEYDAGGIRAQNDELKLTDPRILENWPEFEDGVTHAIQGVFPNFVVQQVQNSLAVRQLVPRGVGECELYWTMFGYADDTPEQTKTRLRLANLLGPAGLVSMEDGIVGNFIQRAIGEQCRDATLLEMGGRDVADTPSRVSEASVRGFWQSYREHMGL